MKPTRTLLSQAILVAVAVSPSVEQQPTQSREHLVRRGATRWGMAH
jgi:hypothetical protein